MPRQRILHEQSMHKSAKGRNSRTGSNHNHILGRILWKEHRFPHRSRHRDLVPGTHIAQKVGTHSLLRRIDQARHGIVVFGTTNAQTDGIPVQQVAVPRGSNGVEARLVLPSVLRVGPRGDDAERLSLDVVKSIGEFHEDVFDVARGIVGDEFGPSENCRGGGRLRFGKVEGQFAVRVEMFEEVLRVLDLHARGGGVDDGTGRCDGVGRTVGDALLEFVRALEFAAFVGIEELEVAGRLNAYSRAGFFDAIGGWGECNC
mmetsp:Transcript_12721/g.21904  ORF Transcript_12721/g.21904 Transcript_12721/m.21904 type:complete len:259 (+) Transcript_12721:575-1351(+)